MVNTLPAAGERPGIVAGPDLDYGDAFYAMEFVEGESLQTRLNREGPLTPLEALEVGLQVARALAAAEREGLVHRDLKPSNIMLLPRDDVAGRELLVASWVKLIDFGLAQVAREGRMTRRIGSLYPEFASPEQLAGQPLSIRSDIYSLGCTLWYALTGEFPFPHGDPAAPDLYSRRTSPSADRFQRLRASRPVVELLRKMLAKSPQHRPQTAVETADAISDTIDEITSLSVASPGRFFRQRSKFIAGAFGIVAGLLGLFFLSSPPRVSSADKSLTVLPFRNLSSDPQDKFFAEGLEDDLLSSLVKVRGLKVIGRRSSSQPTTGKERAICLRSERH